MALLPSSLVILAWKSSASTWTLTGWAEEPPAPAPRSPARLVPLVGVPPLEELDPVVDPVPLEPLVEEVTPVVPSPDEPAAPALSVGRAPMTPGGREVSEKPSPPLAPPLGASLPKAAA